MPLLYSLKAFWILLAVLLAPELLLLVTMFLMLLHVQSQVMPHFCHSPGVGAIAQLGLEIRVTSQAGEVHYGGVSQVNDHQLFVKLSSVVQSCVMKRSVALA